MLASLELTLSLFYQVISKDLLRMSMKLEKIDSEIANKSLSLSRTQTLSKSVGLESEIRDLQKKKMEISAKVESLNERVNVGKLLMEVILVRALELNFTFICVIRFVLK